MRYNADQRNARLDLTIRTVTIAEGAARRQTTARRGVDAYITATFGLLSASERAAWRPRVRTLRAELREVAQSQGEMIRTARQCNGAVYRLGGVCPCPAQRSATAQAWTNSAADATDGYRAAGRPGEGD